jgi:cytosine deaminase
MDLIIRGANLPDGRTGIDIGIMGERIAAVEKHLQAKAAREIDARGRLVCPPFVDAHFHMDATLSLGLPAHEQVGHLAGRHRSCGAS